MLTENNTLYVILYLNILITMQYSIKLSRKNLLFYWPAIIMGEMYHILKKKCNYIHIKLTFNEFVAVSEVFNIPCTVNFDWLSINKS